MKSILPFSLILFFCFQFSEMRAELPNERKFVEDILQTLGKKESKFDKRTKRVLKKSDLKNQWNSFNYINIPVVFSTKELTKVCKKRFIGKDSIFYYLNGKSLSYDEVLICKDSLIVGYVFPHLYSYAYYDDEEKRDFRYPLVKQIIKIKPDVIFSIYNIPRCYWFVKNNKLFVLSYDHTDRGTMENFMVHDASSYVRNVLEKEDLCFMYHKKVVVIGW